MLAVAAGRLADAPGARRGRAPARGDLRRDDLPRRLPAAPRDPHRALEVHPALRRLRAPGAGQLRRQRQQGRCWSSRLGRAGRSPRSSSTTSSSTPPEGNNLAGDRAPAARRWRRCGGDSRPGCGRPRTRCSTGRFRHPRGRSSTSSGRSRPMTRFGSWRIPRSRHPRNAGPARRLDVDRVPALAALEDAEAAVSGAQIPQSRHQSRLESSPSSESKKKNREKMPWVTIRARSSFGRDSSSAFRRLTLPSTSLKDSAPSPQWSGSSGCAAMRADQRRSFCCSGFSSP